MIASCWPMTRLCSSSSMRMSFCDSASVSLKTGMPVHIGDDVGDLLLADLRLLDLLGERHLSSSSRFFCVSLRSLSRRFGLLELLRLDRGLLLLAHLLDLVLGSLQWRRAGCRRRCACGLRPRRSGRSPCPAGGGPGCFVGEHRGGAERVVRDRAAVVGLVAVAEAAQDLDSVVTEGSSTPVLQAALEGGVALEVLAVLVERRRADRLRLPTGQRRLEDGGRGRAAWPRLRRRSCGSSMKRMMSPRWVISFITFFRRSSNSPRYFEPPRARPGRACRSACSSGARGTWFEEMRAARPSTTAVLPTPGSRSGRVVLRAARRICITRSISVWRPTTGSSLPSAASLIRFRPNWSRSLSSGLLAVLAAPPCCRRPGRRAYG